MNYRVILNDRAEGQLEAAYLWWLEHRSPNQATRWYNEFLEALHGLQRLRSELAVDRPGVDPFAQQRLLEVLDLVAARAHLEHVFLLRRVSGLRG
jgi:plasmid stabilization system protein ParE